MLKVGYTKHYCLPTNMHWFRIRFEAAVYAVMELFEEDTTHGFISIDSSKAFNKWHITFT